MATSVQSNRRLTSTPGRLSIAVVSIAFLLMLALLYRTQVNAAAIRAETNRIAATGQGINSYTDSIIQLNQTNKLASSILTRVQPIHGALTKIGGLAAEINTSVATANSTAGSIDRSAKSINASAASIRDDVTAIRSTTGNINSSLSGVNTNAGRILATAQEVQQGLGVISSNLNTTLSVTRRILSDAEGIFAGVARTNHEAACVDNGLNGRSPC
jgi:methyl-accepting chemotaxis protein